MYTPSVWCSAIITWIILACMPFSIIDNCHLWTIFKILHPNVTLFGKDTVQRDITTMLFEKT